jgi:hypothetical protein
MKNQYDETQNYIYYLRLSGDLPEHYIKLATVLKEWKISLIPVTPSELLKIGDKSRMFVLAVSDNVGAQRTLTRFREVYLDLALLSRKVCFFDANSFAPINIAHKLERSKSYYHFALPISFKDLVKNIVVAYYNEKQVSQSWPGGKRAKLPV